MGTLATRQRGRKRIQAEDTAWAEAWQQGQLQVAWQWLPGEGVTCGWGIKVPGRPENEPRSCMQDFLPWCWELLQLTDGLHLGRTMWPQGGVRVEARGVWTPAGLCSHPGPRQGWGTGAG